MAGRKADKYYDMLLGFCQDIAENPEIGRIYPEVATGLCGLKANRHIIFYRKLKTELIEITRILHGKKEFEKQVKRITAPILKKLIFR